MMAMGPFPAMGLHFLVRIAKWRQWSYNKGRLVKGVVPMARGRQELGFKTLKKSG